MIDSAKQIARSLEWRLTLRILRVLGKPFFWFTGRKERKGPIDLAQVKNILVVRLDEIGDVLLTIPFLRELRRNLPNASITLLVKPAISNLVELCPYVDEVLTYDPGGSRYLRSFQATSRALRFARGRLWARNYDLAIVPRWDVDSSYGSIVSYLSGAQQRVGFSERVTENKSNANVGLNRLFTHVLHETAPRHEVERGLDLIRFLGGIVSQDQLEMWIGDDDEVFADRILGKHGIQRDALLLAVAPGAGHPRRRWPISNFADMSRWFTTSYNSFVVVLGSNEERILGDEIGRRVGIKVINVTGETNLLQAAAVLKRCHLFLGNDAGLLHLAAAVGLPVVEISCHPQGGSSGHANSPERFGPWGVPHRILRPDRTLVLCGDACNSDQAHCILRVSVEQAKEAVASVLAMQVRRNESASVQGISSHSTL